MGINPTLSRNRIASVVGTSYVRLSAVEGEEGKPYKGAMEELPGDRGGESDEETGDYLEGVYEEDQFDRGFMT